MRWHELDAHIPADTTGGPLHAERTPLEGGAGWQVEVAQPGRHARDTDPPGSDFVVRVTSDACGWAVPRPFTHADIFSDLQDKCAADSRFMQATFARALAETVGEGADPARALMRHLRSLPELPGLETAALLECCQALALAEHRRYGDYEPSGGRCLPARYAFGIIFGLWDAAAATRVQRRGISGLRRLRAEHGREPSFEGVLGRRLVDAAPCADPRPSP